MVVQIKTKSFRFADIPLENFACPPEIIAASRYVEANIGDSDDSGVVGHSGDVGGDRNDDFHTLRKMLVIMIIITILMMMIIVLIIIIAM